MKAVYDDMVVKKVTYKLKTKKKRALGYIATQVPRAQIRVKKND